MMPYCEYHKCKEIAEGKPRLLRMWSSYSFRANPTHHQEIWLCNKHLDRINKLLGLRPIQDTKETE